MCTTSALLAYKEIVWDLSSLFPFVFDFLVAFGILVPQPGMEPMSLQWKRRVLTIGLPGREFSPHFLFFFNNSFRDFPGGAVVKNPPASAGDTGSLPGPGRSHMPRSN